MAAAVLVVARLASGQAQGDVATSRDILFKELEGRRLAPTRSAGKRAGDEKGAEAAISQVALAAYRFFEMLGKTSEYGRGLPAVAK